MSERQLPVPVRQVLTDSVDAARLMRLWRGLDAARARQAVPVKRAWVIGVALALVAILGATLVLRASFASPLHLADGRDVPTRMASGEHTRLAFDDGSTIDVGVGSALDLLETTPRTFAMAIRSGTATFDVTPGGPRAWRIECGSVTVEVVGTRFSIERARTFVRVAVSRGAVLVRGERVPDRVVRLGPGQAIVISLGPAAADGVEGIAGTAPSGTATHVVEAASATASPASAATPVVQNARRPAAEPAAPVTSTAAPSASVVAFEAPKPQGAAASSIDDELATADRLRREARFAEAAAVLERALSEHGGEASAPLTEFSLGRLYLDSLGDASLARVHVARALGRGLPSEVAEDAEARFVEASVRAGDLAGARDAALRYHARYPDGRHASDVDRWLSSAP